ncbi:MAG: sigma factor [Myxococcota bacterium]
MDVEQALLPGHHRCLKRLTAELFPVVRKRVIRVLSTVRSPNGTVLRSDADDLVQEVFAHLFNHDARILRQWDPARGASLQTHIGLVAERRVRSLLRSGRWTWWREEPSTAIAIELHARPVESPAVAALYWECVIGRANKRLSKRGQRMMDLLFIKQRPVAEVSKQTGMTVASLYAWRSRLQKLVRELAHELHLTDRPTAAP